jgi:hypothetical protein
MFDITYLYRKLFCRKGHGVHSPFVFDLITNVIEEKSFYYAYQDISLIRKQLAQNNKQILCKGKQTSVKKAIRQYGISQKEGEFLFRLTNHYKPRTTIAIGSSLGLTPLYLSRYDSTAECITLEGEPDFAEMATHLLKKEVNQAHQLKTGSVVELFQKLIPPQDGVDCFFADKNVEMSDLEAIFNWSVLAIYEKTFWVIAGIHSSPEKLDFWEEMCHHHMATVAVDLYQMGILFFDPKLTMRTYKTIIP